MESGMYTYCRGTIRSAADGARPAPSRSVSRSTCDPALPAEEALAKAPPRRKGRRSRGWVQTSACVSCAARSCSATRSRPRCTPSCQHASASTPGGMGAWWDGNLLGQCAFHAAWPEARSGEQWWPQASSGAGPFRRAVVASALAQASPRGAPAPEAEIRAHFQPARRAAQRGVVPRVVRAARAVR